MTEEDLKKKAEESYAKQLKDSSYYETGEEGAYICGFITGAKENGVIWHDLRKNPNDLPKEFSMIKKAFGIYPEEKYIHIVLNQDGEYVHYLSGDWYYIYNEDIVDNSPRVDVIAWCEIPKFEVEE